MSRTEFNDQLCVYTRSMNVWLALLIVEIGSDIRL